MSTTEQEPKKLWGGRFVGGIDELMEEFNQSLSYDKTMWAQDIQGSKAFAKALQKTSLITEQECEEIQKGLDLVAEEWNQGTFEIKSGDEDIHTANERRLKELIGEPAGKLHTGRSRNDQVVTDMRLWLREQIDVLGDQLLELIQTTADRASNELDVLMPGYTHLQQAQPIRWSHLLMCHAASWQRDYQRLMDLRKRCNVLPLGSGALAGNPFGIDRTWLAEELGFDSVSSNSLDAVSDRDFIIEFLFWGTLHATHLSRISEDLIIYSSREFSYITIADAYSTGSSLMPQKKNPDALELLRGKSGRTVGQLITLLTSVKGLPTSYNKDLQEDKEPMFDMCATMRKAIPIATGVISTLIVNEENMKAGLSIEMLATDVADYLVRKGIPFRDAHHIVGEVVRLSEDTSTSMDKLTVEQLKEINEIFDEDIAEIWDFEKSVDARNTIGGTAKSSVQQQIDEALAWVKEMKGE